MKLTGGLGGRVLSHPGECTILRSKSPRRRSRHESPDKYLERWRGIRRGGCAKCGQLNFQRWMNEWERGAWWEVRWSRRAGQWSVFIWVNTHWVLLGILRSFLRVFFVTIRLFLYLFGQDDIAIILTWYAGANGWSEATSIRTGLEEEDWDYLLNWRLFILDICFMVWV